MASNNFILILIEANLNLTALLQKRIIDHLIVLISVFVPKWNFIQMWPGSQVFVYQKFGSQL